MKQLIDLVYPTDAVINVPGLALLVDTLLQQLELVLATTSKEDSYRSWHYDDQRLAERHSF